MNEQLPHPGRDKLNSPANPLINHGYKERDEKKLLSEQIPVL
jgi:hypothetical protein